MKRALRMQMTLVLLPAILIAAGSVPGWAGDGPRDPDIFAMQSAFEKGNELYGNGDYEGAMEVFQSLIDRGVEDKDLYYNLGNAYYKNGEMGRAVLNYERALRLSPRDRDTRENLALVESLLRDRQFIRAENSLKRAIVWLHRNLSTGETAVLVSACYALFCLLAVIWIFRKSDFVVSLYRRFSILSPGRFFGLSREQDLLLAAVIVFGLFIGFGASTYQKVSAERRRDRAVVVDPEISVFSGPTRESTLQFKIHEGTRTIVRMQREGWVQIDLPGDLSGWVEADTVENI
ncbi:MAG: tetratricopeptide repeat protein [Candidatus Latescibacteria bacterium]|nr:tetratricopeptide repeat protein [Candidatus Latescibacterota bacterium]NIM22534.1 tetratricopeptide repeat protein [Candidatus Latescibacterota bacterium]NIM64848.1 tetratricopeptide repeat protein [Candidatus Latescibacterota bacterium]NIO01356.1 tetratricopeptide repeat protein [Candidatus Latescibacterota bacterium]NIO27845.1 tetratricopeptide repeat protein [Candidatus Latescibacterota bacterium]